MPLFGGPPNVEKLKEKRNVKGLIRALSHDDVSVRQGASQALGQIGDTQAVEPLIGAASDGDARVRVTVAKALGQIGDARALPLLVNLLNDEEGNVRAAAVWALGNIGDVRAVEPLAAAISNVGRETRQTIVDILDQLNWQPGSWCRQFRLPHRYSRHQQQDAHRRKCWCTVSANLMLIYTPFDTVR